MLFALALFQLFSQCKGQALRDLLQADGGGLSAKLRA
jgi:hypothetical protein